VKESNCGSCRSLRFSVITYRFVVIGVLSMHVLVVCGRYNSHPRMERHMYHFRLATVCLAAFAGKNLIKTTTLRIINNNFGPVYIYMFFHLSTPTQSSAYSMQWAYNEAKVYWAQILKICFHSDQHYLVSRQITKKLLNK
jgi:hypothetical protein